ncbi:hypothetical protein ElyMa_006006300 [Elysia marginata]|uniref:Uncharacterized protein n=1 Tax=Elysia marginata TaxID=1093978 RepID=A0AAV4GHB8_9GAST|nr:hypothetical protein ElyMa_006006300 [Elysia marginata]
MADGLTYAVSQSSAVKPTLPMGVITSYVIAVVAQGLYSLQTYPSSSDCSQNESLAEVCINYVGVSECRQFLKQVLQRDVL